MGVFFVTNFCWSKIDPEYLIDGVFLYSSIFSIFIEI